MKKLLIAMLVVNGLAYADCSDPAAAQKAVGMLHKYNKTAIQVNYSSDKVDCSNTCKSNIAAQDSSINVIMKQVDGTGVCKYSKPS